MRRLALLLAIALTAGNARAQTIPSGEAAPKPVSATVDLSRAGPAISPYIYGQFIEHIGGLIEHGIWAEMLDDRKFYLPVTAQPPAPSQGRPGRMAALRWTPIGPAGCVVMDSAAAWVGDHSPRATPSGDVPCGLRQAGMAVRQGRRYIGHIVLSGDPALAVTVTLAWGPGEADHQTVRLPVLRRAYTTVPFTFMAGGSSDSARLEIAGSGHGSFHVGAVSLMPADNVEGFRREVVGALAQLRSGIYRFPGGNFVSGYDWRDGIGPRDRRPPRWDYAWRTVQPNDVGLDEFMTLCRLLGVEPHVAVNTGFGDARSAAEEVEYANGPTTSPMGKLRAANGHPAPYHVRFWAVGNEMWGGWQLGVMPLDQYVIKHNMVASAMRRVDPTIKLIASGASPEAMMMSGSARRITGRNEVPYGSPADWSFGMLSGSLPYMDYISEHYYVYDGRHYDLARGEQVPVEPGEPLVEWARRPANLVRVKYEHYQEYYKRIPALAAKPVPVSLDEWAYSGVDPSSYKPALAYAWALQEMFRHSGLFQLGGFTFAGSTLSATRTDAVLNPVGLVFRLYRDHFGTIPLEVTGDSPQPAPKYPVGGDQPAVNAGSPTFPLDVAAALSADRRSLTVAVVNPTEATQQLRLDFAGRAAAGPGTFWRMAPASLSARIDVGKPPQVQVLTGSVAARLPELLEVPPISITIYELPLR